ncbi:hypothetical protein DFR67_101178 [Williamsia limnetica]|uniref:Uncharacterized protein n=1 Tax=Williamsia limnetica TaxID=882452 RepID=A0A318RPG5_WILLI|nr:hypothetical protein [Williamsia limnetica]PYE20787.1 hypothetical protein DFR67_101178 [Williamsia limnetica]
MDIDEVADELYGLDPGEFVRVRTAHVKEARAQGDRSLAKEISQLRKPTVVAWMVNMLAREHSEDVENLLELGAALRDAQRHLAGDDLRALTTQRQKVVRAMARQAGDLAADHGQAASENALREVGQSLHAALADPDIAEQVRAGRLVTAVSYSGMGPAGMAVVGGGTRKSTAPPVRKKAPSAEERKAARDEVAAAEQAERDAESALASARADAEKAAGTVTAADTRIEELRGQLAQAEQERQFAVRAEQAAVEQVDAADSELEQARERVTKSRVQLESLGR